MIATVEGGGGGLPGVAEAHALLQVGAGDDQVATKERDHPHGHMARHHEDRIGLALRQLEELLAERGTGGQPRLGRMKHTQTPEHPEALRGLPPWSQSACAWV